MEQTMVPQIDASDPNPNPDAAAMALTGNTTVDLQNIAKELGVQADAYGNVIEATAQPAPVAEAPQVQPVAETPAQPQAVEQPKTSVEVPKKFQNADGTPNVEKIEKATKSIEEMVAYYKAKEREGQQLQNKVNNPPAPQTAPPVVDQALEIRVANDILTETDALVKQGYQPAQAQALAVARVQIGLQEARYKAEVSATDDIRRELGENRMATELQTLLNNDASLLTPEVADRLIAIRNGDPKISYRDAYIQHLGEVEFNKRSGQVKTPTPTGQAAKAPPTPVGPVTRVQQTTTPTDVRQMRDMPLKDLEAEVRRQFPGIRVGPRY